jgi:hypothetical protein
MNMSFCTRRFNLYLALVLVLPLCSCSWFHKKQKEKAAAIRIHTEARASVPGQTQTISLMRAMPVEVTVDVEPVVTEGNVLAARLIESEGGYAVLVRFDESGGWALEQATSRYPGKHLVIFGQWGEKVSEGRFLAAPLITRRNATAEISFTPDASREEMQEFVDGLNNLSRLLHTPQKKE